MSAPRTAQIYSIPPPIGGMNVSIPDDLLPTTEAILLENLRPIGQTVELVQGVSTYSSVDTEGIDTLYNYVSASGSSKLFAGTIDGFYDYSTPGSPTTITTVSNSGNWQGVNFRDDAGATSYLVLVNGADTPRYYNGTATGTITYTGIGTPSNLVNVASYKSRLYFCAVNDTKIWYGPVNAYSGALTSFQVGGLLQRGGYPMWCGSWTKQTGLSAADSFVIVSSQGEILVYEGDNPGATNWTLVGRMYVSPVVGRRCAFHIGGILHLITKSGIIPLTALLPNGFSEKDIAITQKIDKEWQAFAGATPAVGYTLGAAYDDINEAIYVTLPQITNRTYFYSIKDEAWSRFALPLAGATQFGMSICFYEGSMYLGGFDGLLRYQMSASASVTAKLTTAQLSFGTPESIKRFNAFMPIIKSNKSTLDITYGADVDYKDPSISTVTRTLNGEPISGGYLYRQWLAIDRMGTNLSVYMSTNATSATYEIKKFLFNVEQGGII